MALSPDDPARAKYAELRANGATREQVLEAMDTYEIPVSLLVKGLSPGHAEAIISELLNHMVGPAHLDPGMAAVSSLGTATKQEWLDGPLFGGELNG